MKSIRENFLKNYHAIPLKSSNKSIYCTYTKGSGKMTPQNFKRRAYWLLENPKFIFVHYLNSQNAEETLAIKSENIDQKR